MVHFCRRVFTVSSKHGTRTIRTQPAGQNYTHSKVTGEKNDGKTPAYLPPPLFFAPPWRKSCCFRRGTFRPPYRPMLPPYNAVVLKWIVVYKHKGKKHAERGNGLICVKTATARTTIAVTKTTVASIWLSTCGNHY